MFQIDSPSISQYFSIIDAYLSRVLPHSIAFGLSIIIALVIFAILLFILVTLFVYLFGWA